MSAENLLVVSDLHFGEQLLPGAQEDRRRAVELADQAFREFLRYHAARRQHGRPWRLVIAGDMFDFMSVVVPAGDHGPASDDEKRFGLHRGARAGVERMRQIGLAHHAVFRELVRFAAAGHRVDIVAGNHDIELILPEVVAELRAQLAIAGATDREQARIAVVPWFVHVPGVAWIEHGHHYDEGCSFEFNLAPCDPDDGKVLHNADYAAIRYLSTALPGVDASAVEEWSFWGFLAFGLSLGALGFYRILAAYTRFVGSLIRVRGLHRSVAKRSERRRQHASRIAGMASSSGVAEETLHAVDRLSRTPLTTSWKRLGRMLMLDRCGVMFSSALAIVALLVLVPLGWAIAGAGLIAGAAFGASRVLGRHLVTSQLPIRSIPKRLQKIVQAPVIVFGHTHDPRWQSIHGAGAVYVNSGTWLPATRPGLRRAFTHVMISPRDQQAPKVELRQWRDGAPMPFSVADDAQAALPMPVTVVGV